LSQRFTVFIDDREAASPVAAALMRMPDIRVQVQRLAVGDYQVDDALLFERKTLPDLAGSIKDGRLFKQALRLANAQQRGALILEGRSNALAGSRMHRDAIQGALIALTVYLGLPLLRAVDGDETARLIRYTAIQGRAQAIGAVPRPGQRPRGKRRTQSHILQGLPGIGPERARRLLDRFGSVEAVIAASAEGLACVDGIGERTANAIRWAVEEPVARYSVQTCGVSPQMDEPWLSTSHAERASLSLS